MLNPPLLPILQAVRDDERKLVPGDFDERQLQRAIDIGLGPLLRHLTAEAPFPPDERLLSADLTSRVLTADLRDAVLEILDATERAGIPVTLLKGISVSEQCYPAPHLRVMGDLDLLTSPEVQRSVEASLLDLGYRPRSHRPEGNDWSGHHHGVPLYHPGRGTWVEVHTGLFPKTAPVSQDAVFAAANVRRQTVPSSFYGRSTQRLSPELQLLYIASSWSFDLYQKFAEAHSVVPLVDVLYLLKRFGATLDWERVLTWSSGTMAGANLYLMLSYLDRRELISVPRSVVTGLRNAQYIIRGPARWITHGMIERYVLGGRDYGKFLTKYRAKIIWGSLLTPGSPWRNLGRLPWNVLFPPNTRKSYSVRDQLRRIGSLFHPG